MSLSTIVQVLGGDLYDRGRRANIPAPGHSLADRSVSLLLEEDRVVVHTFGGSDWREVLDHLRELKLVDAANAPLSVGRSCVRAPASITTSIERHDVALRLWEGGRTLTGTASERYCRSRAITRALPDRTVFRHNPQTPVSAYRRGGYARPALLAAIQAPDGAFTAVEVTYLTLQGQRATDLRLNRKTLGPAPGGCAVRLDPAAEEMLVGEGIFTALSASGWFGLPAWALMSTRNLRVWRPPEGVRSVLIAADRGPDGEASAERLRAGLVDVGVAASLALPPRGFGDWNDWSASVKAGDRRTKVGRERARRGAPRPGAGA